ncbi:MAG: zinc-finger domain-containing protein [Rhodospirillaceae bacterium]|nr:zinc-finger domain-containing protein [Rhodospirillaceae bacterium]
MEPQETITAQETTISCDGGGGPLGHPNVFLKIGEDREIVCPYCSRRYVLAEGAKSSAGH